jgi:heme-degrading monooxygenase HmoA
VFVAIALHHAAPEHEDEFIDFMRRVIEATAGAPGLLEFRACRDPATGVLAGYSRWESAEAFQAGLPRIGSLRHERRPEWTTQPDQVITLVEI